MPNNIHILPFCWANFKIELTILLIDLASFEAACTIE